MSSNDITAEGVPALIYILGHVELRSLNLSKNNINNEGMIGLIHGAKSIVAGQFLERLDCSCCKVSDKGFHKMLEDLNEFPQLRHIKLTDNYISEKYEKVYA